MKALSFSSKTHIWRFWNHETYWRLMNSMYKSMVATSLRLTTLRLRFRSPSVWKNYR